ncbi:tyrosine-type recombinase/integrase [Streptomyces sp. SID3343]|uniref:tyrosine-type recombinase/integrase n=1 Tax=Streptomyces sp. SID3343 TaxID=2690260 RepID=UPI001370CD1D|nr:tyrosine-type recombinase/integrase [Streptomyces sp. SID3343]
MEPGAEQQLEHRPSAEIALAPSRAEDAFARIREQLGTVAPRDPVTRKLRERRERLAILAEICERPTFDVLVAWLSSTHVPSTNTKRAYADDLRFWAEYAAELGHERFSIGCLSADDLTVWRLAEERRGAKPRSINRRLSTMSSLARFEADRSQRPLVNPVTRDNRIKVDRGDTSSDTPILEKPELQRVLEKCADAREALVVTLVYTLAGRVSEMCEADVDALKRRGDGRTLTLRRKGDKTSDFPLPAEIRALFDVVLDGRTEGPLLLDASGARLDRFDVDRMLTRLGRHAGVLPDRDLTPHVLRASRLTHMHDEKVDIDDIRSYADHAELATTLVYVRRRDTGGKRAGHAAAAVPVYGDQIARWV